MFESILTLVVTTALLLGSPGPAPMSLAAVGAGYPLRQGVKFLAGILAGLLWVMFFSAILLTGLFSIHSNILVAMQIAAALYIIWLAYNIATAPIESQGSGLAFEPGFWQGFVFNLINPKAYAAFVAVFSGFILPIDDEFQALLLTAGCCFIVAVVVDGVWLIVGRLLKEVFSSPKQGRILRVIFAILIVVALTVTALRSL